MMTTNRSALLRNSAAFRREVSGVRYAMPSRATLDRMAEERLTGNWNVTPENQCGTCFQQRSANGACGCEG